MGEQTPNTEHPRAHFTSKNKTDKMHTWCVQVISESALLAADRLPHTLRKNSLRKLANFIQDLDNNSLDL